MKLGAFIFPTEETVHPARLGREVEARGYESLWLPEHTHIPASRRTPWPAGGDLPPEYWTSYDPFVALAQAAAVTERLRLATGISLVIEHDPIVLAKTVASLDALSGGRFIFGVGAGWNAEEMENHGTAFRERWHVLEDRVRAMKSIWTEREAEYHGRYHDFDPIWAEPKPHQQPHPPVLIGAASRWALRRVVAYADGWLPIHQQARLESQIPELRRLCDEAGRDPSTVSISVFGAPADAARLEALAKQGVERGILFLPTAPEAKVLELLDRWAPLVQELAHA